MAKTKTLTVELARVEDLFIGPDIDVARLRLDPQPGMDSIMDELRAARTPAQVSTTLTFPDAAAMEGASAEQIQTLLDAFCRSNIRRNQLQISAIRREGLIEMGPALALLAVTTLISLFITRRSPFSDETNQLAIAGLGILSWVGMWRPLGALLYDWWEPYRDNKLYRRLIEGDLFVVTGDAGSEV